MFPIRKYIHIKLLGYKVIFYTSVFFFNFVQDAVVVARLIAVECPRCSSTKGPRTQPWRSKTHARKTASSAGLDKPVPIQKYHYHNIPHIIKLQFKLFYYFISGSEI